MPYFALDTILIGGQPVEAGHEVPGAFVDPFGDEQTVDLDRLVQLGAAEKAKTPSIDPDAIAADDQTADGAAGGGDGTAGAAVAELSYHELKAALKERGLSTKGKAPELAQRLADAIAADADAGGDPDPDASGSE